MITPAALREVAQLQNQADAILHQRTVTRADAKRADILISKIAQIRHAGISSDEIRQRLANHYAKEIGTATVDFDNASPEQRAHETLFRHFLSGTGDEKLEAEVRANTFLAGKQTPIFSSGPEGGFLVPTQFCDKVAEGRALVDPLFDENVVTLVQEPSFKLPPLSIPGWDLSTIAAVKVAETVQHNPDVIPALNTEMLNNHMYRLTLAADFEFNEDAAAYGSAEDALARAIGIGMARGIGADLINGDGATGPQGVLTGAANSGITTANSGSLVLEDFTNILFSVNKIYRNSPKAAWLVSDSTLKLIRNAKETATGRPLIDMDLDTPTVLGKPVYVCPSLEVNPSIGGGKILFGDLSHYYVHASAPYIKRRLQYPGLVEYGKVAWTALQMVDAVVDDPTDGALPPIVYATLHA